MRSRARWGRGTKGEKDRGGREGKAHFLSTNQNTQEIPPWATVEDSYCGTRFLPAGLWMASPRGLSHVIISKLLLSSPWAKALPCTHAGTQSLFSSPRKQSVAARAALHPHGPPTPRSQAKFQTLHPQGTLGTSAQGQRHTVALLLWLALSSPNRVCNEFASEL